MKTALCGVLEKERGTVRKWGVRLWVAGSKYEGGVMCGEGDGPRRGEEEASQDCPQSGMGLQGSPYIMHLWVCGSHKFREHPSFLNWLPNDQLTRLSQDAGFQTPF